MSQTPSQWAQGLTRCPSVPVNTSAPDGNRQLIGSSLTPIKAAAAKAAAKMRMRLPMVAAIARVCRRLDAAPVATWDASARAILRSLPLGAG